MLSYPNTTQPCGKAGPYLVNVPRNNTIDEWQSTEDSFSLCVYLCVDKYIPTYCRDLIAPYFKHFWNAEVDVQPQTQAILVLVISPTVSKPLCNYTSKSSPQLYLSSETIKPSPSGTLPILHGTRQIRGMNHTAPSYFLSPSPLAIHLQQMHFHVWLCITSQQIAMFASFVKGVFRLFWRS